MNQALSRFDPGLLIACGISFCFCPGPLGSALAQQTPTAGDISSIVQSGLNSISTLQVEYSIEKRYEDDAWTGLFGSFLKPDPYVVSVRFTRDEDAWHMMSQYPNVDGSVRRAEKEPFIVSEETYMEQTRYIRAISAKYFTFRAASTPYEDPPPQPTILAFLNLTEETFAKWAEASAPQMRGDLVELVTLEYDNADSEIRNIWLLDPSLNYMPIEYRIRWHGADTRKTFVKWKVVEDDLGNDVLFPLEAHTDWYYKGKFNHSWTLQVDEKSLKVNSYIEPSRFILERRIDELYLDGITGILLAEEGQVLGNVMDGLDDLPFNFDVTTAPGGRRDSALDLPEPFPSATGANSEPDKTLGKRIPSGSSILGIALLAVGLGLIAIRTRGRSRRKNG